MKIIAMDSRLAGRMPVSGDIFGIRVIETTVELMRRIAFATGAQVRAPPNTQCVNKEDNLIKSTLTILMMVVSAFTAVGIASAQSTNELAPTPVTNEIVTGTLRGKGNNWFLIKAKRGSNVTVTADLRAPRGGRVDIRFRTIRLANGSLPVCCTGESRLYFAFGNEAQKTLETSFVTNYEKILMWLDFDTPEINYTIKLKGFDIEDPRMKALPLPVKNYLASNYPGWTMSKVCFNDPEIQSQAFVKGEFDGDGKPDYAIAITKGSRMYTLALLTRKNGFKAVALRTENAGEGMTPVANMGVARKGEEISSGQRARLQTDGIVAAECDANSTLYYWQRDRFVSVEER